MITYETSPDNPTSPTMVIPPEERLEVAAIAALDSTVSPDTLRYLALDKESGQPNSPAILKDAQAIHVQTVLSEIADTGKTYTGAAESKLVTPEERAMARALLGRVVVDSEATDSASADLDITPSTSDQIIKNSVKRIVGLGSLFNSGYIPRHADTGEVPVQRADQDQPSAETGHNITDEYARLVDSEQILAGRQTTDT